MNTLQDSATYSEVTDHDDVREVPLSHLSIEVGHLFMDQLRNGEVAIRAQFQRIAPWVNAATAAVHTGGSKPRVSTCFLIDDYFRSDTSPKKVLHKLTSISEECGITIDYVAREAGCCVTDDDVPLAELTAACLLAEPAPGTNGSRPPVQSSGWLCNGERSHQPGSDQAMRPQQWRPPQEFGKRNHSVFLDVELWCDTDPRAEQRLWSCAFLASVWQLLRLGMLRHFGEAVAQPQDWPTSADWPERWDELPTVIQLNPDAAPFAAYQSLSILPRWYLPIEHAVELTLGHLSLDEKVTDQIVRRGAREGLSISRAVTERLSHIFIDGS